AQLRDADEPIEPPVEVVRLLGAADRVAPSPDGRWLAITGVDEDGLPDDAPAALFVSPAAGGEAVAIAPELDLPIGAWQDADLNRGHTDPTATPFWRESPFGLEVVALVARRGRCDPWRFPIAPATGRSRGAPEPLATGDSACWQLTVAA